jgi:hypothetical protein
MNFTLEPDMLRKVNTYARSSGQTASTVLNDALTYWYEMQGEIVQEEMHRRNRTKRQRRPVPIDSVANTSGKRPCRLPSTAR